MMSNLEKIKHVFVLALFSCFFTEVITGSTHFFNFIQPGNFLMLMTVGYGLPVLLIREIGVRNNYGIISLFMCGMVYGIYNEGMLSHTIFSFHNSPIAQFSLYGVIGNLRLPWMLVIISWHALQAVLYPLALLYFVLPDHKDDPWLSKKATLALGIFLASFAALSFFSTKNIISLSLYDFDFLCVLSIIIAYFAYKMRDKVKLIHITRVIPQNIFLRNGLFLYITLFFLPLIFCINRVPVFLFYTYFICIFCFSFFHLQRYDSISVNVLSLVALGGSLPIVMFTLFLSLTSLSISPLMISSIVSFFIIIFAIRKVKRRLIVTQTTE